MKFKRRKKNVTVQQLVLFLTCSALSVTCVLSLFRWFFKKPQKIRELNYAQPTEDFLILPHNLPAAKKYLTCVILSHLKNYEQRATIRSTWARETLTKNFSVFFVLGHSNGEELEKVRIEANFHQDIIQANVQERYGNLLNKLFKALKFIAENLNTEFVLKTDDDVLVNVARLKKSLLAAKHKINSELVVLGNKISGATPASAGNRWFVPQEIWPRRDTYPDYVSGSGYVVSLQTLRTITGKCSIESTTMPLEDVFLTGICRKLLGIKIVDNQQFVYNRRHLVPCLLRSAVVFHSLTPLQMQRVWRALKDTIFKC